jgi:hypothetical protein
MANAVYCIAKTRTQAERIVTGLQQAGIPLSEVSVLFPDQSGTSDFAHENRTKAPEGATAGAATGGAIGGVLGLLAGARSRSRVSGLSSRRDPSWRRCRAPASAARSAV